MHLYFSVLFVSALTHVSSCVMPGGRTGWRLCGRAYTHMASGPCVFESVLSARQNGRTSTRNHPMSSGTVFHLRASKTAEGKETVCISSLSLHIFCIFRFVLFVCEILMTMSIHIFHLFQFFICNPLQRLQCHYLINGIMVCTWYNLFQKTQLKGCNWMLYSPVLWSFSL